MPQVAFKRAILTSLKSGPVAFQESFDCGLAYALYSPVLLTNYYKKTPSPKPA
jgi:hypothetical protein